jgi:hypothetical protein
VPTGTTVLFTVVAGGAAPLAFQWRKDGVDLPGATASTLELSNVQPTGAGSYEVSVTNAAGSVVSAPAVLTVQPPPAIQPPSITGQPQNVSAPAGTSVNFSVTVAGTAPLKFQWRRNGAAINGAINATLTLNAVQAAEAGSYDVVVSNSAGTVTSAAAVLVFEGRPPIVPPTITGQPQNVSVPLNSSVNLHVAVAGTAPFKFQWRFNGTEISGANSASLVLNSLTAANAGRYDVLVANEAGDVRSEPASLTVTEAPFLEITRQPRDVAVAADGPASFDVTAKGAPALTFQWFRSRSARTAPVAIAGANKRTFKIERVTREDLGFYRVEVTNGAGLAQTSAVVRLTLTQ